MLTDNYAADICRMKHANYKINEKWTLPIFKCYLSRPRKCKHSPNRFKFRNALMKLSKKITF